MKVAIVGGVAGGAGTAARLRRLDEQAEIILFEKDQYISFANCGLPYYIGGVITEKKALQVQTPQSFNARFNVDVRVQNEVLKVDTAAKTLTVKNHADGTTYEERYDKLVLSPGAAPLRPPLAGADQPHVFTLRNIPDTYAIKDYLLEKSPKTAVVVGGGFIGVEMAENLTHEGVAVTLVEMAPQVMLSFDADVVCDLHNKLREKGVRLVLENSLTSIEKGSVTLKDGTRLPADMVVLAIGVRPATGFLRDSGIELGPRGEIVIDQYMHTSAPDVWALGDAVSIKHIVSGRVGMTPLAGPANRQARIVADNVAGIKTAYKGTQGTAIVKVFDMAAAAFGVNERQLKEMGIPYKKSFTNSASHAGYYPGGSNMSVKMLYSPEGKILGAQITGVDGVDKRIDVLATAQRAGLSVWELTELDLAYAPPFSSAKDPVNFAGYVAGNVLESRTTMFFADEIGAIPADDLKVDVRTPKEFAAGAIPGFVNIPVDEFRARLADFPKDKTIWITCRVGQRGYIAEQILKNNGFKDVRNLSGGWLRYEALEKDKVAKAAKA